MIAVAGRHRCLLPVAAVALVGVLVLIATLSWPRAANSQERLRARTVVNPTVEVVITSADLSQALTRMPDVPLSAVAPGTPVVDVNESTRGQTIRGVGGAMTDSSAWLMYDKVSPRTRHWLMNALFGTSGIHLNFMRVPMGASDFTAGRRPYSYDDLPPGHTDPKLTHFSIRHDTRFTIPALKQALSVNPGMFVLANPWSPPAWMKTNDRMSNLGDGGRLKSSSGGPLADYFVKFLQAYAGAGIHVAAVTPQNEPGQGTTYPGMNWSESDEAAFVRYHLAPALKRANLRVKIYGYDYGWRSSQTPFAFSLATGPSASSLSGISTHCYGGDPSFMSTLHEDAPRLDQIVGECSPGIAPASTSEMEIASMRNWASAVALWNLALDPSGGPVQPPNSGCHNCTGIVTVDEATGRVTLTRDYYQLGQLSKFVHPGAVRIDSNDFVSYQYPADAGIATPGLDDVAFQNPDGSRVLVAYNSSAAPFSFAVQNDGLSFSYTLQAGATGTFVWDQPGGQPPS